MLTNNTNIGFQNITPLLSKKDTLFGWKNWPFYLLIMFLSILKLQKHQKTIRVICVLITPTLVNKKQTRKSTYTIKNQTC